MGVGIDLLLDEFRHIEICMSDLYDIFRKMFPQDQDFWWTISQEELNHASLLSSLKKTFVPLGKYPSFIDEVTFEVAFNESQNIRDTLEKIKNDGVSREEAMQIAYCYENSIMEKHYQQFMNNESINDVDKVFQQLNNFDKDHAERIQKYAEDNNIVLDTNS